MSSVFTRFAADESGATAIEYGLIVALIAMATVASLTQLGTDIAAVFTTVSNNLTTATN